MPLLTVVWKVGDVSSPKHRSDRKSDSCNMSSDHVNKNLGKRQLPAQQKVRFSSARTPTPVRLGFSSKRAGTSEILGSIRYACGFRASGASSRGGEKPYFHQWVPSPQTDRKSPLPISRDPSGRFLIFKCTKLRTGIGSSNAERRRQTRPGSPICQDLPWTF